MIISYEFMRWNLSSLRVCVSQAMPIYDMVDADFLRTNTGDKENWQLDLSEKKFNEHAYQFALLSLYNANSPLIDDD